MKKILVSLGLILSLALCCAFMPVNAAEACTHEKVTFQYYLEGQVAPTNCKEAAIAKVKCDACKAEIYKKVIGEHNIEEIVTDATCTAPQTVDIKCTLCDYKEETYEIAKALGHDLVVTELKATCEQAAGEAKKCTRCDYKEDFTAYPEGHEKYEAAKEHAWDEGKVVAATCKEKGYTLKTCATCKATKKVNETEVDKVNGHVKSDEPTSVLKEADCKNPGIGKYTCKLCGESMGYQSIPAQHKYGEFEVTKAAECGKNAKGVKTCLVCGDKAAEAEIPNTALKHTFVETVKDATCDAPQWVGPVCSVCEYVDEEKATSLGEALGHHYTNDTLVDATCTQPSGVKSSCDKCGKEKFVAFEEGDPYYVAALAHKNTEVIPAVAATCVSKGLTAGEKCKDCGTITVKQTEVAIDKTAHKLEVIQTLKAATCTVAGVGKYQCSLCKAADTVQYKSIDPKHAEYVLTEVKEAATCTKAGKGVYACPTCGDKEERTIAVAAHDFEYIAVEYKGADVCLKDPAKVQVCKVCKALGKTEATGKAPGHKWGEEVVKDATCTEGQSVGIFCTVCETAKTSVELTEALGHKYVETKKLDATCDKANGAVYTCSRCGDVETVYFTADMEGYKAPLAHKNTEVIPAVAATCVSKGLTAGEKCKDCGKVLVEQKETAIDPENHKLELVKTLKAATCTVAGVGKYECTGCEKADTTVYQSIQPSHAWGELIVDTAATCGAAGKGHKNCANCTEVQKDIVIPATGNHTAKETVIDATCTEAAKIGEVCAVCNKVLKANATVEGSKALGHDLVDKYVAATCTEAAHIEVVCTRCDKYKDVIVLDESYTGLHQEALGHKEVVLPEVKPTCSTTGLSEGKKCERCGEITEKQIVTAKTKKYHKLEVVETLKAATCTVAGVGKYQCTLCKDPETVTYASIAPAHQLGELVVDEAATCGKDGKGHKDCAACDYVEKDIVIPATGKHTAKETVIDATCTEAAKIGEVCSVCEKVLKANATVEGSKPLGHTLSEVYVDATCTEAAYISVKCSVCDYAKKQELTGDLAVAAKGHKEVEIPAVAATCSAKGLTAGKKCSVCGTVTVKQTETAIVATAHKLAEKPVKVLKEATCEVAGVGKYQCEYCDYAVYQAIIDGHKYDEGTVKTAATCAKEGEKVYTCTLCKKTKSEKIEKLAHNVVETVKDATCTAPAKVGQICKDCGFEKDVVVVEGSTPAPHTWTETVVDATCGKDAYVKKACSVCKAEETESIEGTALEHKYEKVEVKGTCAVAAYSAEVCANCGDKQNVVNGEKDAANHTYEVEKVLKAATCTEAGVAKVVCKDCKDSAYKAVAASHAFAEAEKVDATGALVYNECANCTAVKTVAYFGKKAVAVGTVFASLAKFAELEAAK